MNILSPVVYWTWWWPPE